MEGRPLDDADLVESAKAGDVAAYEELVSRYQGIAFRVAYVLTGSDADADDAVQEAFVKAYYALDRFRTGSSFRPWILKIAANEARNRRRSSRRREGLVVRAAAESSTGDAAPSPEAAALEAEEKSALIDAVNSLSERDRVAIACRFFLGLSESETAMALGCARGTVKSRLSRALRRLRAVLADRYPDVDPTTREGVK